MQPVSPVSPGPFQMFGEGGALGGVAAPLLTGMFTANTIMRGDNSVGGAIGESLGGLVGYQAAQSAGNYLADRFVPKKTAPASTAPQGWGGRIRNAFTGRNIARGLLKFPVAMAGATLLGSFGNTVGNAVLPWTVGGEKTASAVFGNESSTLCSSNGNQKGMVVYMYKTAAAVRNAEVRGVTAAFIDAGLVKVASREAFDELTEKAASLLPYNYDVNGIAEALGAVISADAGQEKTAEEKHASEIKEALGELMLMKVAGQIDKGEFNKQSAYLVKEAFGLPNMAAIRGGLGSVGSWLKGGFKGTRVRNALAARKANPVGPLNKAELAKGLGQSAAAYGLAGGGLLGGGYLGKKLYNRLSGPSDADVAAALSA